jgi:hypothetical protein
MAAEGCRRLPAAAGGCRRLPKDSTGRPMTPHLGITTAEDKNFEPTMYIEHYSETWECESAVESTRVASERTSKLEESAMAPQFCCFLLPLHRVRVLVQDLRNFPVFAPILGRDRSQQ